MHNIVVVCKKEETAAKYRKMCGDMAYVFVYNGKADHCGIRGMNVIVVDDWSEEEIRCIILPFLVVPNITERIRQYQLNLKAAQT